MLTRPSTSETYQKKLMDYEYCDESASRSLRCIVLGCYLEADTHQLNLSTVLKMIRTCYPESGNLALRKFDRCQVWARLGLF